MNTENLAVFKISHELTINLYQLTKKFPIEEKFGLITQIRRAASSICANLMEGGYRQSKNEYKRFTNISRGSTGELKYHLLLAKDLNYISEKEYESYLKIIDQISKMLYRLTVSFGNSF